jgi:ABC-type multidrug transport system ATPase subunit
MDEATQCDRVALMKNGRFLNTDTPQNLVNQFDTTLWEVSATNMAKLFNDLQNINGVKTCFTFGATHHVTVDSTILDVNQLHQQLNSLKYSNIHIQQIPATIEDCFMALDSINVKKS